MSRSGKQHIGFDVPIKEHRALVFEAAEHNISMTKLVLEQIQPYLDKLVKKHKTAELFEE